VANTFVSKKDFVIIYALKKTPDSFTLIVTSTPTIEHQQSTNKPPI
jgi:hypothetical protein